LLHCAGANFSAFLDFDLAMLLRLTQAFALLLLSGALYAADTPPPTATPVLVLSDTLGNTLTLVQAEQLFLLHNRELQVAQSLYAGAQADIGSSSQRPNPNLSLNSSSIGPANGIGRGPMWNKSFDTIVRVDQLFERGDKRKLRGASAQFLADAAQHDVAETQRQQLFLVRAAYYDLLLAQHKKLILEQSSGLFDNAVVAAQLRLKAGDIAPSEVARLQVDAGRAANDARSASADLIRAQFNLAYLIGAEANAVQLVATDSWPNLQTLPAATAQIEQRADVQAAQQRVYAAEKNLDGARALQTRDVTLGLQYERYPGQPTNNGWGLGISMPLQINNTYQGESRRASADLAIAQNNLARVRAQAFSEISRSTADLAAAQQRVQRFQDELLASAQQAADAAEFAYKNGALGVMDLLDARRTLRATRLEAETAQADYAKAQAAYQAALSNDIATSENNAPQALDTKP